MPRAIKTIHEIIDAASNAYPDDDIRRNFDETTGGWRPEPGDGLSSYIASEIVDACRDAEVNRQALGPEFEDEDLDQETDPVLMTIDSLRRAVEDLEGVISALTCL